MAIIKSFSSFQNLSNFSTFIVDTNPTSEYFRITELKDTFSGGKNGFLIEGSEFLKETTEVKIEILDVEGNPIYYEPGKGAPDYYEGLSTLVSVHIYPDTPIGTGKITVLGELKKYRNDNGTLVDVPEEWKGVYNVKWEKTFKINRNLANEDIVRFYRRPQVAISEIVKPIFSKTIPSVTQSGSVEGVAIQPTTGTNLSTWTAGTLYKLKVTDGPGWTGSVDENTINIPSLGYSPTVREVLNNSEVLVDIPYSIGNIVSNFTSSDYTTTFEYVEGQSVTDSALTGSFAVINISNLKTFVGDVARVKVFRKSRNEVTDFQFVQESKLESTELLRDITVSNDTQISYGNFTDTNLSNYWLSSSDDHPLSVNVEVLQSAVKCDYDYTSGGVQHLITSESFLITKDVEYTLNFKTLVSGSLNGTEYIKGYFSSSDGYQQTFLTVSGSDIYKTRQNVSQNILASPISSSNAKLVFEISGSDWYISNVSLKNAQETSFSPDEFVLIQEIPRKLAVETFDFRFEFYDINNNYIPVDVTAVGTFDGGNDYPTSGKLLTFESDRNAFRFSTGSIQNPENQQVKFTLTQNNLVGSATFASSAYDVDGNYLNPSEYSHYPGFLTSVTPAGALLTINNFTGSRVDGLPTPFVGSIVYTASLDGLEEYETVYRLEDGENAPTLIVTSDANQFIYEPTTLSPKPSGQSITIRAQRKNLASYNTPLIVNSGSNYPPLNELATTANGVTTYTISATEFSSSFASNNFDSVTYSFTGSDVYGNDYSDEITISKVINFDGVSIVLSTENTSFNSDSTGTVTSTEFDKGDGTVDVRVGSNVITHSEGLGGKNTFDIISVTPSTGLTANSETPTTNSYGISAMSVDSGTLTLLITYKAGDNSTTLDFTKVVNYSKAKKAQPSITFSATPQSQTIDAKSNGDLLGSITDVVISGFEGNTPLTYNQVATLGLSEYKITGVTETNITVADTTPNTITNGTIDITALSADSTTETATIEYKDSEGTTGTSTIKFSLSKSKKAAPNIIASLNPQTQTVDSDASFSSVSAPSPITLVVNEGGSNYSYTTGTVTENKFRITGVTGGTNNDDGTITPTTPTNANGTSGTITYSYTNSEGTAFTGKTIDFSVGVAVQGDDGVNGVPGANGVVINISPASQTIKRTTAGVYATPAIFTVTVSENGTLLTHTTNATLAVNQFKFSAITNGSLTAGSGTTTPDITPSTPSTTAGLTTSFTVTYKDSKGTESSAIPQTHVVNVSLDGTTGPGVVHTGVWAAGRAYQYSDGLTAGTGRRDTVLWSSNGSAPYDTYYAVNSSHTSTNNNSTSTGRPDLGGPWTSLGTQDFFVAAKIGIFEDSYVQNTLNVGTNNNGGVSSANITLAGGSANPYISIGQSSTIGSQGYNVNGIFLGQDGGVSKLSLKSATNSLLWDGTSLTVNGGGTFTGTLSAGVLSSPTGNIGGFTIGGSQLYTGTKSTFASTAAGVYLGNDGIALGTNSPFKVTSGGALTATGVTVGGEINASSGTFTGNVSINGTLTAQGSKFGTAAGGSGNHGIYLASGNYWYDDGRFAVGNGSTKGIVWTPSTATFTIGGDVNIGGSIASALLANGDNISALNNDALYQDNASDKTDGSVGGWQITTSTISAGNGRLTLSNSPYIAVLDASNNVKVQIRTGALTPLTGGATTTLPSRTYTVSWPLLTYGVTGQAFFGASTTFTPASAGVYSGTVTCGAVGVVASWNTSFSGYISVQAYLQISDNASFSGTTNIFLLSRGEYPSGATSGTISFPAGGSQFWQYNFASTATHYIRMVWQRTVQGNNIASGVSFSSATATSSTSAGSTTINQVELTDEGFQVVNSSVYYFKVAREGYAGTTPFAQVGGDLSATGNIISYYSDKRLKDILGIIDNPLDKIKKLNGVYYKKNKLAEDLGMVNKMNEGRTEVGLIAQEVEEVLPEIVHLAPIDTDTDTGKSLSGENYLTIDYTKVVPLLVESVKELTMKIEKLEEENKKLRDGDN